MGISIRKDRSSTYGLKFIPVTHNIAPGTIPAIIKADLKDIIKRRDYYLNNGIFYPPVWFIDAKVERVELLKREVDVRD